MNEATMTLPQITGACMVSPATLLLTVQQGVVKGGVQRPYVPLEGETLEQDRDIPALVYIVRDGERIGVKVEDRQKGTQRYPFEYLEGEELDLTRAEDPASYRVNGTCPLRVLRKTKPNNVTDPGRQYAYLHRIYLVFDRFFHPGETLRLTLAEGIYAPCGELTVVVGETMSEAIQVNQLGYRRDDPSKKAYLSQWTGLGGGIGYDGIRSFYLMDEEGGTVYEGSPRRLHDGACIPMGNGELSTRCPLYELDFSDFCREGRWRIRIPEIGVSFPFTIGEHCWETAFRASMNALFCQRSGIQTGKPYTEFERPRCYHPADGKIVYQSGCSLFESGNGLNCYGTDTNNFGNLLRKATEETVENAWGGYFDACDWDRRIQHLRASRLQTELYLLFPEYFKALKLPIPESGNGTADILNEARWNIDFYKRLQLPNGGIRGGIEQEEHPILGQCGWQDTWKSYAYAPDFWSSYYYASAASRMAYALRNSSPEASADYRVSAEKAFSYAEETYAAALTSAGHKWTRNARKGVITERENAACDLFRLTGDPAYEKVYLAIRTPDNGDALFTYACLPEGMGTETVRREVVQQLLAAAERELEVGARLPYHLATEAPETDFVTGYGAFCATPRTLPLLRAHRLTGDRRYLAAAIAAADFTGGANPDNLVMTTGLGQRWPQNILHHDSRMTGQPAPLGISVFGPQDFNHPDAVFPTLLRDDFLWPGAYEWPTVEGYLDIYRHPCVTEYTVMETLGPNGYTWGYFAARAALE